MITWNLVHWSKWLRAEGVARLPTLIGLSITLLGFTLRLLHSTANSLTLDETSSLWLSSHSFSDIFRLVVFERLDATPPLYYFILHPLLELGQSPLVIRSISILTGSVIVGLTFYLALALFNLRIATLSGLVIATAPYHITYSQVARSYMLAALFALVSLILLARVLFVSRSISTMLGLVAAMAVTIGAHYVTFPFLVFAAIPLMILFLRRRLYRPTPLTLLVALLIGGMTAAMAVSAGQHYFGSHTWIPRPTIQSVVKTAILLGTGDPSYGPIGMTPLRLLSLAVLLTVSLLGVAAFLRLRPPSRGDEETARVGLIFGALVVPWVVVFAVSQVYSVYREYYLLYLVPPLAILLAWSLDRSHYRFMSVALLIVLLGLNARALRVYYTEPFGEQWREAIETIYTQAEPQDVIMTSPGYYSRPVAYHRLGQFPSHLADLTYVPAAVLDGRQLLGFSPYSTAEDNTLTLDHKLLTRRVWLISGEMPMDDDVATWLEENFRTLNQIDFVGLRVQLLQGLQR